MDVIDRETILSLARCTTWPCVTLYMPTHRVTVENDQDLVRFRNLLREADRQLRQSGMRAPQVTSFLERASALLDDPGFWREAGDGLAVFVRPDETVILRLEVEVPELLSVSDRFTIRPLVPALREDDRFWILALSKNDVRLYEADSQSIRQADLGDTPRCFDDAMKYEDSEHAIQFHSGTPSPGLGYAAGREKRRAAVFHGHGGTPDVEKDQLVRYLRLVDAGVADALHGSEAPLIVAGVESIVATYREVASYPAIASSFLAGNPDEMSAERLHADAREQLEPYLAAHGRSDLDELESRMGTKTVSTELTEIIPAAHEGRVRALFVAEDRDTWGEYDASAGRIRVHEEQLAGDRDLTELAVAETFLHGGDVYAVAEGAQMPPLAALLRY